MFFEPEVRTFFSSRNIVWTELVMWLGYSFTYEESFKMCTTVLCPHDLNLCGWQVKISENKQIIWGTFPRTIPKMQERRFPPCGTADRDRMHLNELVLDLFRHFGRICFESRTTLKHLVVMQKTTTTTKNQTAIIVLLCNFERFVSLF